MRVELEKHRGDRAERYCGFEARSNDLRTDLEAIVKTERKGSIRRDLKDNP